MRLRSMLPSGRGPVATTAAPPRREPELGNQRLQRLLRDGVARTAASGSDTCPLEEPCAACADATPAADAGVDQLDVGMDAAEAPHDAGVPIAGGVPMPPIPGPGGACADPAEQAQRDAFLLRTDLHLERNQPSTGRGMFDAAYLPLAGLMPITVKIAFDFVAATRPADLVAMGSDLVAGRGIGRFIWTPAEEADFQRDFVARTTARWSSRHMLSSTKPCWGYSALPIVTVLPVDDAADAHVVATVHKSPGPGIDYDSATDLHTPGRPSQPVQANLWQSDLREDANFRSGDVAKSERRRLETALTASGAAPVRFPRGRAVVDPADEPKLVAFANACKAKNPSDPVVPIFVSGFASAEGEAGHNLTLSADRAAAVETILTGANIPQPVIPIGLGQVGAPNDAASRRADIAIDSAFETSYAANRYSVAEHEFGHMLGNVDEYRSPAPASYLALIAAAGAAPPASWGDVTSSQMSAGVDVLPRHYATFWEALGRMTAPDLTPSDWAIR